MTFVEVVGRIAAVVVMITIGVVHRIHRTEFVTCGRHRRAEAVVDRKSVV